jgi:cytochrome c peroxidase
MQLNQSLDSIISERQNNRLIDLKDAINELEKQLNSDHENYLTAYKKLRYAYKQWEYLGEYKYPEMIKDHINGAPLPKIEKNSFSANILQPKGLQVIDELIAEDQDDSVRAHLKTKTLELKNAINNFQSQLFYFDYEIFEAQRKELLRIFTLGITGFDTPGSQLAIPDALAAVSAMYYDFTLYLPSISTKDADLAAKIKNTYNSAIQTLSQSVEFESFDRLKFLTSFIQPLYNLLSPRSSSPWIFFSWCAHMNTKLSPRRLVRVCVCVCVCVCGQNPRGGALAQPCPRRGPLPHVPP